MQNLVQQLINFSCLCQIHRGTAVLASAELSLQGVDHTSEEGSSSVTAENNTKLLGEGLHFYSCRILCVYVSR